VAPESVAIFVQSAAAGVLEAPSPFVSPPTESSLYEVKYALFADVPWTFNIPLLVMYDPPLRIGFTIVPGFMVSEFVDGMVIP
jgi:hypothetical protein